MANMHVKRCPFCGGDDIVLAIQTPRYGPIVYVECVQCGAKSKAFRYYSDTDEVDSDDQGVVRALEAWNRRSSDEETAD